MGYQEACADGIRLTKDKYGDSWFFPLCHICGEEVTCRNYKPNLKYTCKECKRIEYLADRINVSKDNEETKENKFQKAVKRIEAIPKYNFKKYERAYEVVHKHLHKDGWFASTEEIMVAIELLKSGMKARHQVKFGRYKADFVLPEEKIVLEVDGILYHTKNTRDRENIRDNLIILALGLEWEVVRITDKDLNKNISMLSKAIKEVREERQLIRQKNNGQLPSWYYK